MLINTGSTGEFTLPLGMGDTVTPITVADNPWYQAANYPSSKNCCMTKHIQMGKHQKMSMRTCPMEEYLKFENNQDMQAYSALPLNLNGILPHNIMNPGQLATGQSLNASVLAATMAQTSVKRRKFRWTSLWVRYYDQTSGTWIMLLRNTKKAHGVQFMVRNKTYTAENVPYFTVHMKISVEFKDKHQQVRDGAFSGSVVAENFLFPFSYAGGNQVL